MPTKKEESVAPLPVNSTVHAFPLYDELPRQTVLRNLQTNIPRPLRKLKAYVVFKYHPRPDGGRDKKPYYVRERRLRYGKQGTPEDVARMATFEEAIECYAKTTGFDGIGLCALADHVHTFIDVDHCFDPATGELNDLARELLDWGTYAEFSPGGRGLRLIVSGNLGLDKKNHAIGLEVFSTKGFVTLTGMPFGSFKNIITLSEQRIARLRELVQAQPAAAPEEDLVNIPSPLTKERARKARAALKHIDPDLAYEDWIKIGQALHSGSPAQDSLGFKLWVKWSMRGEKFAGTSVEEMRSKWLSFQPGRGITLGTLFKQAKEGGYDPKQTVPIWEKKPDLADVQLFTEVDNIPDEPLDPIAPGLFDHVGAYMFIGRSKIGKSRVLGLLTAMAMVGGKMFDYQIEKCKVLALALEERKQDVRDRMRLYMVDIADHKGQIAIVDQAMFADEAKKYNEKHNYMEYLEAVVAKFRPRIVYLDTLVKMRMLWLNEPETKRNMRITEDDYRIASLLQDLAIKYKCVLIFTIHGNKRKTVHGAYDPFESVGTTSWTLAGCTGALVLMDIQNFNPMEDTDTGQRIFSIRGRFRQKGDEHLLLQNAVNSGTVRSLGPYREFITTQRQQDILEFLAEAAQEGDAWVTAREIAREIGTTPRYVKGLARDFMRANGRHNGMRLVSSNDGYRLERE